MKVQVYLRENNFVSLWRENRTLTMVQVIIREKIDKGLIEMYADRIIEQNSCFLPENITKKNLKYGK